MIAMNRMLARAGWRQAMLAMAAACLLGGAAQAADNEAPIPPATAAGRPYEVEGFRSAHFGMGETEVKRAIQADFGIKEKDIVKDTQETERTTQLTITVPDLVPDTGPAKVTYVLGYNSKKLIHVAVSWGAAAGEPAGKAKGALAAANLLQRYFLAQNFPRDNVVVNTKLANNSTLVFRGVDVKGHAVELIYGEDVQQKPAADGADKKPQTVAIPYTRLSYIENPAAPDIFNLKSGQF